MKDAWKGMDSSASSCVRTFEERFRRSPDVLVRSPGRVNLIGGHVDYSEGLVLPACISQSLWLAASANGSSVVECVFADLGTAESFDLADLPGPVPARGVDASAIDYAAGVAAALAESGHSTCGLEVAIQSDVPIGAGVSSSAALEVALLLAWERLAGFSLSGLERALCGQWCENMYVGVGSGIMDQYAIANGEAGSGLLIDCRLNTHRNVPLPVELRAAVVDCGVRRRLSASGFNDRRAQCEQAVELLKPRWPELRTLRDVGLDRVDEVFELLPSELARRTRHVVTECDRVVRCAEALEALDRESCRDAIYGSHCSSRDDYETTIPELDVLAAAAMSDPSCWGARVLGGGFGGCVLALAPSEECEALVDAMGVAFARRFGRQPEHFVSAFGAGAEVL